MIKIIIGVAGYILRNGGKIIICLIIVRTYVRLV